jgi:hypothetical protein
MTEGAEPRGGSTVSGGNIARVRWLTALREPAADASFAQLRNSFHEVLYVIASKGFEVHQLACRDGVSGTSSYC